MKVTYSAHNVTVTDDLTEHVMKRADKIESLFKGIQELNLALKAEKHRFDAEMIVTAPRVSFYASSHTDEIVAAIDTVADKIVSQIRRYRDRVKDRRNVVPHREVVERLNPDEVAELPSEVEATGPPIIVGTPEKFASKPLTVIEAAAELRATDEGLLLFLNAETRQVNLLYEMAKGTYGWVEPDFT